MVTQEQFKELNKKFRSSGLVISRIPQNTRDKFVKLSEEEFSGDYGMLMKWCVDQSLEYQKMKNDIYNFDMKLDLILSKINSEDEQSTDEGITLMSGRRVTKEVKDE